MLEEDGYDLGPLLELTAETRRGAVRSPQSLFERVAEACVQHLPYQVADILAFDRRESCLRRVAAAFRCRGSSPKVYTSDMLRRLGAVNITIEDVFSRRDDDSFHAAVHEDAISGKLELGPVDVNVYSLEQASMSATALRETSAYNNLRQAYIDKEDVDPRYIIAYEHVHSDDLLGDPSSDSLLRSMLVAPFCSPGDVVLRDDSPVARGALIGKLRLLNRTKRPNDFAPEDFTPFDRSLATILAQSIFLAYLNFEARPRKSRPKKRMLRVSDLPVPRPIVFNPDSAIVGASGKLRGLVEAVRRRASMSKQHILLIGKTGTGKELLATEVHVNSPRAEKPFKVLNCAALSDTLMESELFGHVKGAFTGAIADRTGLVQSADGGTFFLDEIGDMPLAMQAKLLRTLDSGEVIRVGSNDAEHSDVRFVAATKHNLAELVHKEAFRDDVCFRLGDPLIIPTLSERGAEDILMLLRHFIEATIRDENLGDHLLRDLRIDPAVCDALVEYHFPGNVRELEKLVGPMFCSGTSGLIEIECLPLRVLGEGAEDVYRENDGARTAKKSVRIREQRRQTEEFPEDRFLDELEKQKGNLRATVRSINWPIQTVYSILKQKLDLDQKVRVIRKKYGKLRNDEDN